MVNGKNTDDVQYVRETDGCPHLFTYYLMSVFGTYAEGHKSVDHSLAGNTEVMGLWEKFSNEGMTNLTAEEHLMMAYERI